MGFRTANKAALNKDFLLIKSSEMEKRVDNWDVYRVANAAICLVHQANFLLCPTSGPARKRLSVQRRFFGNDSMPHAAAPVGKKRGEIIFGVVYTIHRKPIIFPGWAQFYQEVA